MGGYLDNGNISNIEMSAKESEQMVYEKMVKVLGQEQADSFLSK